MKVKDVFIPLLLIAVLAFVPALFLNGKSPGQDTSAARDAWLEQNGHKTYPPCNEALKEAWDKPSLRTPRGPAGGGCCGAGKEYWNGVWDSMEQAGAPKR